MPRFDSRAETSSAPTKQKEMTVAKAKKTGKVYRIAVLGGDGTGPEVVAEGLKVLAAVAKLEKIKYKLTEFDYGGERYLKTGKIISDEEVEALKAFDAIALGAIGHPKVQPGILEKGLLLKLRFQLDQYINLRPVKLYPGVETPLANRGPEDIDFAIIRENTEGLYSGMGREIAEDRIARFHLKDFVDFFIVSAFVHFRKPDLDIYRLALDVAHVQPQQVAYIEDRPLLCEVATELGIHSVLNRSSAESREILAGLGLAL